MLLPVEPRLHFLANPTILVTRKVQWFLVRSTGGFVPVVQGRHGDPALFRHVDRCLEVGGAVAIFPEGNYGPAEGELLPFKKGFAHFAIKAHVPVVPVALSGTKDLWFRKRIKVVIGEPLQTDGHDPDSLTAAAFEKSRRSCPPTTTSRAASGCASSSLTFSEMALARVLCEDLVGRESEISLLEDALLADPAGRRRRGDRRRRGGHGQDQAGRRPRHAGSPPRLRRHLRRLQRGRAVAAVPALPGGHRQLPGAGGHRRSARAPWRRRRRPRAAVPADGPRAARRQARRSRPSCGSSSRSCCCCAMRRGPARSCVVLEDLHWADPATRELLDYATRRLRSTNVLILATYRTDEMHRRHALLPTIEGWRRSGQVQMVELKALQPDSVADIVCAIFEESRISDEFRDFLYERSEGNPFVIEEMLRDALDRGDIFHTEQGWDRKAVNELRIPRTVRDTILHRLERLEPRRDRSAFGRRGGRPVVRPRDAGRGHGGRSDRGAFGDRDGRHVPAARGGSRPLRAVPVPPRADARGGVRGHGGAAPPAAARSRGRGAVIAPGPRGDRSRSSPSAGRQVRRGRRDVRRGG